MNFKNKIYELRKAHNYSQEQLAEQVGVSRQTISKWELGETAPDIKQAQMLAQVFNVSLDEMLCNDEKKSVNSVYDCKKKKTVPWKKIIVASTIAIVICLLIVAVFALVHRSQILYPEGIEENIVITIKDPIIIEKGNSDTIVFSENNKPTIVCELPEGFTADTEISGLYTDENGNFIKFNSDYSDDVVNPLFGTDYYSYYEAYGYHSYMNMARAAMYKDFPKLGILSPVEDLYLYGGAKLIRQQICAEQDADYYAVDGGLTEDLEKTRLYGFALHFNNTTWLITLKDCNENYYYISIKAPNGIGKNIETVSELLSSIFISE